MPYYVRALLEQLYFCFEDDNPATMSYTFDLPNDSSLLKLQPNYVADISPLNEVDRDLVRGSFRYLEKIVNVHFMEQNKKDSTTIFYFSQKPDNSQQQIMVEGYGAISEVEGYANYWRKVVFLNLRDSIGFNTESFKRIDAAHKQQTIFHEILHWAFHFKHPFGGHHALTAPREKLTSFSIMNYASERDAMGQDIIPITPMPADIEAAEYVYGKNAAAGKGDTVYYLRDYAKFSTQQTISTLVDRDGVDTISALDEKSDVTIDLRQSPFARSNVLTGYVTLSQGTDIENVMGGWGKNTVILNQLNNVVYFPPGAKTTLYVDALQCGHDIVLGFNGTFVIEKSATNTVLLWEPIESGAGKANLGSGEIRFNYGTKIQFDANNSVTFANIKPEAFDSQHVIVRDKAQTDVLTEATQDLCQIFSELPCELLVRFQCALYQGMLFVFLTSLTEEGLRYAGCTAKQIQIVNQAMQCLLTLCTGSVIATSAGFLTSSLLHYFGFSEKTCNLTSAVVATTVRSAQHISPLSLAKTATSMVGSYAGGKVIQLGGRFTLWAKNKVAEQLFKKTEPEVKLDSIQHTYPHTRSKVKIK
jgi:hypothetical protein